MGKTSGLAITALVLGILSILIGWIPVVGWMLILLTLVFGYIALSATRNKEVEGRGLALTGLVLGGVALFCTIIFYIAIFGGFLTLLSHAKDLPNKCMSSPGFPCNEVTYENNVLTVDLRNLADDVTVLSVVYHCDGETITLENFQNEWKKGNTYSLDMQCPLKQGKVKATFELEYIDLTIQRTIHGEVVKTI